MPNFVEIARTAVEISQFLDFSKWWLPLSWILIFLIFNVRTRQEGRTTSLCQISTKSLQSRPTYGDFYYSRWLPPPSWFSKLAMFNGRNGQEGWTASPCQISSKSLEPRPTYVSFNIMLVRLENAYSRPSLGGFWGTFFPNDITHHPNPQKDHPWAEPRHLSHKPRKSVARFELGGYDFTGGRIFHFPIDWWMGLTTVQRYCAVCDSRFINSRLNAQYLPSYRFDKKSYTVYELRLVPKSVTLNDLVRRNGPYFALFYRIW